MILIPAIDLKDGKCVRLMQGDFGRVTVYADDPVAMALVWQEKGAERIHIVDLDGARTGVPRHREVIERIVRRVRIPVQLGGGIRDLETVASYLEAGVKWVIIGTAALTARELVYDACARYPGAILVGIDARDGRVAVRGWCEDTEETPAAIAKSFEGRGVAAIVYTDIARDGMGTGVNIAMTKRLAGEISIPVIASGGVAGLLDIEKLLDIEDAGVVGAIIGKALYNGTLDFAEAQRFATRVRNTKATKR